MHVLEMSSAIIRIQGMPGHCPQHEHPCVKGNHDDYCSTEQPLDGFNPAAAEAVNWTRKQLTEEDRQWLRDLKYVRMVTRFYDCARDARRPSDGGKRLR
jgi:hypothetical protein